MTAGHGDHSDLWNYIDGLREDLGRAEERIRQFEEQVAALQRSTPQARQAQYEADLAASGIDERGEPVGADRHGPGCQCPYCYDPESGEAS